MLVPVREGLCTAARKDWWSISRSLVALLKKFARNLWILGADKGWRTWREHKEHACTVVFQRIEQSPI